MKLEKYSFGTGDRFGLQGSAQLAAIQKASEEGIDIAIVWNKSFREHTIVGTTQRDVRSEAETAIQSAGWRGGYYVDADHIGLDNVDQFIDHSDFFTLDVADFIGQKAPEEDLRLFVHSLSSYTGSMTIAGLQEPLTVSTDQLRSIGEKYLLAIQKAATIYRYITSKKAEKAFITEVSMDETEEAQTPQDLFFILAAIAEYKIPLQTIAPKFTGRFNKGVDYQGDVEQFNRQFNDDVCVIRHAVEHFGLPENLKLSVHSGSDKFSIYPGIRNALQTHDAGVHVKTAGTTWLEELIGLSESGDDALGLVKQIYRAAYGRYSELCAPYASVIDIDQALLPDPGIVDSWDGMHLARALRHDQQCADYDPYIRQLLHVSYKVAAELTTYYTEAITDNKVVIATHVSENLYKRHLKPLFL
ncbi:MAG: hypothetical protein HKP41_09275 [Desulfobacterales bacterium]|nr:hypothetical protein [Desulfobacterales bacterium]